MRQLPSSRLHSLVDSELAFDKAGGFRRVKAPKSDSTQSRVLGAVLYLSLLSGLSLYLPLCRHACLRFRKLECDPESQGLPR